MTRPIVADNRSMSESQHKIVTTITLSAIALVTLTFIGSLPVALLLLLVIAIFSKRTPSELEFFKWLSGKNRNSYTPQNSSSASPISYPKGPAYLLAITGVIACIGILPLLLYILFGPKDGNPIGLGLLFFFTSPIVVVGVTTGLLWHLSTGPKHKR